MWRFTLKSLVGAGRRCCLRSTYSYLETVGKNMINSKSNRRKLLSDISFRTRRFHIIEKRFIIITHRPCSKAIVVCQSQSYKFQSDSHGFASINIITLYHVRKNNLFTNFWSSFRDISVILFFIRMLRISNVIFTGFNEAMQVGFTSVAAIQPKQQSIWRNYCKTF